ncbi:unnamed protein product [Caenorhabditis auriculariae]|uniref:BED-type domain-containing protein n=1 Tax=Caenorhabditis auriculariae TaxID=2777116 RepID=A0A8S1GV00_9PELO|nr:unnamed protein product [Caenorhabditis auriculariae]
MSSMAWSFYLDGPTPCLMECILCKRSGKKKFVKINGRSTSNLISHLRRLHEKDFLTATSNETLKLKERFEPIHYEFRAAPPSVQQETLSSDDETLLKLVTSGSLSLNAFGSNEFNDFLGSVNPCYELPTKLKVIHKAQVFVAHLDLEIRQMVKLSESWSFNVSLWPLKRHKKMIFAVVANFLFPHGETKSIVASVKECESGLNSEELAFHVAMCLEEICHDDEVLKRKLAGTTYCGPPNFNQAFEMLQQNRASCSCNSLNVIVTESVRKVEFVKRLTDRLNHLTTEIYRTKSGRKALSKLKYEGRLRRKPVLYDPKKWNSLYFLYSWIDEIHRTAFEELCQAVAFQPLAVKDWDDVAQIRKALQPFYNKTMEMQSSNCLISQVIPNLSMLQKSLEMLDVSTPLANDFKNELVEQAIMKLATAKNNVIWRMASYLDPRYLFTKKIFDKNGWVTIEEEVTEYIKEYHEELKFNCPEVAKIKEISFADSDSEGDEKFENYGLKRFKASCPVILQNELLKYRSFIVSDRPNRNETQNDAIIRWWVDHRTMFPLLSDAALRLMAHTTSSLMDQKMCRPVSKLYTKLRSTKCGTRTVEYFLRIRAHQMNESNESVSEFEMSFVKDEPGVNAIFPTLAKKFEVQDGLHELGSDVEYEYSDED